MIVDDVYRVYSGYNYLKINQNKIDYVCKKFERRYKFLNRRFTMRKVLKQDKGVAGLTILLSVVAMIFIIGFLVMVFALMGSELQTATTDATADAVINDTTTAIAEVTDWFPIIITISVMVALILLTVIIIVAIRSSGILAQGGVA